MHNFLDNGGMKMRDGRWGFEGQVELLAPAGDFETALAAFASGADAVYCGLSDFSARAFAKNLSLEDLRNLVAYARSQKPPRRVYVTFNTLLDECQLEDAIRTIASLDKIGPDALIVQDLGVARICREHFPSLELHASTQLVAHNLEGVLALKELGFRRVVLSRELSLEEISLIARRCGAMKTAPDGRPEMELECFIHGALCYSISGLCLYGAMEKGRSGNRGKCPYCCRQALTSNHSKAGHSAPTTIYPFSMKDLRLGDDARKLAEAGVSSLKIEGRMKSALYVASVTRYYSQILKREEGSGKREEERGKREEGKGKREEVSVEDLETVFSRRTTELYFNGRPSAKGEFDAESPIDPTSLGHLGAFVGTVKRVMKDREGRRWLCFHAQRALEKHDGLQFEAVNAEGRHLGLGIAEMYAANPHRPTFAVEAGSDVEILLPEQESGRMGDEWSALRPGSKIFCSMSNAVKRMFPTPSFRPSDCEGTCEIDVVVDLGNDGISCRVTSPFEVEASATLSLEHAKTPERTQEGVRRAFEKLGGTDYRLGSLAVNDPDGLFAPMSALNALRRQLVDSLDEARKAATEAKVSAAIDSLGEPPPDETADVPMQTLKVRFGQKVPSGEWDEIIVAVGLDDSSGDDKWLSEIASRDKLRLALPVYTAEPDFNRLRTLVKRLVREGYAKWEASDLATLRLLKSAGVSDLTADWTLAALNSQALAALHAAGIRRFAASPENTRPNLQALSESGYHVEFLSQQSTPLFISLTKPAVEPDALGGGITFFGRGNLWITTRDTPRTFDVPSGAPARIDLSWDAQ